MSISLEDVRRIARLARIATDDAEAVRVQGDMERIFGLIEQMRAIDTEGVEPMSHAQDLGLRLREDAVSEPDRHADFQAVAPQVESGLYLVPRVIE